MNTADRIEQLEHVCIARTVDCPAVNKAFKRAIIVILAAWGLLWGYFEFRVYPGVADAQKEIRELYKIMLTEKRLSMAGANESH